MDEIDRRVQARLAGNFPALAAFQARALRSSAWRWRPAARWGLAQIRPDVFFTPYFPRRYFFATRGRRLRGSASAPPPHRQRQCSGVIINFSGALGRFRPVCPVADLLDGSAASPFGASSTTGTIVAQQREISKTPDRGRGIPQNSSSTSLQHRLKKTRHRRFTPCCTRCCRTNCRSGTASITRIRAACRRPDDLIALGRRQRAGDIQGLAAIRELGPYGHVRFNLNGDRLFLPAKLAVQSGADLFTNWPPMPENTARFSSPRGACCRCHGRCRTIASMWTWDEDRGTLDRKCRKPAGFGTQAVAIGTARVRRARPKFSFPEDRRPLHDAVPISPAN